MDALYGKQICERTSAYGDKLEIYFTPNGAQCSFTFVVNDLSQFPFEDWHSCKAEYDHFYSHERIVPVKEFAHVQ